MDGSLDMLIRRAALALQAAGARGVHVFGSAAHGEFRPGSDVDLAVRGLPPERFFRAMAEAQDALGRPLDLVDLDEQTPFTCYLEDEGELVRVI